MIPDIEVKKLTDELRTSDEPMWLRIRQLLAGKDIDPMQSALAYFQAEAPYYEFGVIVADNNEVYQFAFDYLNKDVIHGTFAEWKNITAEVQGKPYKNNVAQASKLKDKLNA